MWGDPRPAARFSASIPPLPAGIAAKGDLVVSVCGVRDRTADGTIAAGRAGAIDGKRVGQVIWLWSRVSTAGCVEALCDDTLSGE